MSTCWYLITLLTLRAILFQHVKRFTVAFVTLIFQRNFQKSPTVSKKVMHKHIEKLKLKYVLLVDITIH